MRGAARMVEQKTDVATIISSATGAVIGGRVAARHPDGAVTILFAGIELQGNPLTREDILEIEAGRWVGEPKLKAQRGIVRDEA